jgi:hypothetical protein
MFTVDKVEFTGKTRTTSKVSHLDRDGTFRVIEQLNRVLSSAPQRGITYLQESPPADWGKASKTFTVRRLNVPSKEERPGSDDSGLSSRKLGSDLRNLRVSLFLGKCVNQAVRVRTAPAGRQIVTIGRRIAIVALCDVMEDRVISLS